MTVVVGAGPVGLFAALAFARDGPVTLVARRAKPAARTRIDTVPLGLLGLLVEFGIPPSRIGATTSHNAVLVAWDNHEPRAVPSLPKAHIDRNLLERELWRRIEATAAVTVTVEREEPAFDARHFIDATGRVAWSATRIVRPAVPWTARTFVLSGRFGTAQQALRVASLPGGYVYRSALPGLMTVGFVGPQAWLREIDADPYLAMDALGPGWILAGVAPTAQWRQGRCGAASVQWTQGRRDVSRIGDADLACDALSSQGIALGIGDAMTLARGSPPKPRLSAHLANLRETIGRCRFSHLPAWDAYGRFLETAAEELGSGLIDHNH